MALPKELAEEWKPIGRNGELMLCVRHRDRAHPMQDAAVYNELTGEMSEAQPMQVWFKWGRFEEYTEGRRGS